MRRSLPGLAAIAVALTGFTGIAGATGTYYPGETLTLSEEGSPAVGKENTFIASGEQADVANDVGGFDLTVFAKSPSVDPACAPSETEESNRTITDTEEVRVATGEWLGEGTTFHHPFEVLVHAPGTVLLCGYMSWSFDTAAAASLEVTFKGGEEGGPPAAGPGGPTGSTPTPTGTNTHGGSQHSHGHTPKSAARTCRALERRIGRRRFASRYGRRHTLARCIARHRHPRRKR